MKQLLFPTDFSQASAGKVAIARELAKQTNANLHILHAYQLPLVDPYAPPTMMEDVMESHRQKAEDTMDAFVTTYGLKDTTTAVICGTVIESIEDYCENANIDLVIMATEGPHDWLDKLTGTVTKQVVSNLKTPVLVLPAESGLPDFSRITYATDLEHSEINALEQLKLFAAVYDSSLECLHIKKNDLNTVSDNAIISQAEKAFGKINWHFVSSANGHVAEDLLDWQKLHPKGIMAVTSRKKGFLDVLFHPSISQKLVMQGCMPLLVLHE